MWAVSYLFHLSRETASTFATGILVIFLNDVAWTHTSQGKQGSWPGEFVALLLKTKQSNKPIKTPQRHDRFGFEKYFFI